ncbi:hypothetical protein IMZ48_46910 [Candidatus Bathyarchaeota archaeon]|nr:hypothetical protein [Candidatus Bathyarchaeota archaeon]
MDDENAQDMQGQTQPREDAGDASIHDNPTPRVHGPIAEYLKARSPEFRELARLRDIVSDTEHIASRNGG